MLDWLRYFPFAVRKVHSPTSVKGPYFSRLRRETFPLGDTVLTLSMPRSNHVYGTEINSCKANNIDQRTASLLTDEWCHCSEDRVSLGHWKHNCFFLREWFFVGPWFSHAASTLVFSAHLIRPGKDKGFDGASFFHSKVFESAVANYLDCFYGHQKVGKKPMNRGPMNWGVMPLSDSIKAIQCDIHNIGNTSKEHPKLERLILLPVSNDCFLKITFDYFDARAFATDPKTKALFELSGSIINSMSLSVGAKTLEQWRNIADTSPDMSLTESFGELKWPIKPEDIGKAEPLAEDELQNNLLEN